MIKIREQLYFQVNVGDRRDVINEKEFINYDMVYSYDLPTAVLKVRISWDKIDVFLPRVKGEMREYVCLFGDGVDVKDFFKGVLVKYVVIAGDEDVVLSLSILGLNNLLDREVRAWKGNSVDVIKRVCEYKNVEVKDWVVSKAEDDMVWLQSESSKRFITGVWKHSYLGDSYLYVGYMGDRVVLCDVKGLVKGKKEPFRFTTKSFETGYIPVVIEPMERVMYQFYASDVKSVSLDEAEIVEDSVGMDVFFGDEGYRFYSRRIDYFHCENVHDKYWYALERNKAYFSNKLRMGVVVSDWVDFELFDLVYLSHANRNVAGFYWIERIERGLGLNNRLVSRLSLCRESL